MPASQTPISQSSDLAIQVTGLHKSFGEVEVLRGVDLAVAAGSVFALLGSNGAGKTTIVKILSTLLKPDSGTARVNDFDVATQRASSRTSRTRTATRDATPCGSP